MLFLCCKDLICKSNDQEEGRILGRQQFEFDEFLQNPIIMEEAAKRTIVPNMIFSVTNCKPKF
jgi:hypothetical protein